MVDDEKSVIILGAGGHAKVISDVLKNSGVKVLGVIAPNLETGILCFGVNVLGDDDVLSSYSNNEILLANGVGFLPDDSSRCDIGIRMRKLGYKFVSVIHPAAIISDDVVISEGVQIMAGVIIQPGSSIGRDCIINTGVQVDHDCKVSENCHLSPGVLLSGGVTIGLNTFIGTGVIVIQNISIGSNCIVAAGSTVFKNISNNITLIQHKKSK